MSFRFLLREMSQSLVKRSEEKERRRNGMREGEGERWDREREK